MQGIVDVGVSVLAGAVVVPLSRHVEALVLVSASKPLNKSRATTINQKPRLAINHSAKYGVDGLNAKNRIIGRCGTSNQASTTENLERRVFICLSPEIASRITIYLETEALELARHLAP